MNSNKINIIATLNSSYDEGMILSLRKAGANFFRLNFSHGSPEEHKKVASIIRKIDSDLGVHTNILADLQGPKLRIGTFKNKKITLTENMEFKFDLDPEPGDETRVCLPHKEILDALEVKSKIMMDDGRVCMEITKKGKGYVKAKVLNGTELSNNKGVNVPDVFLPIDALTNKDRQDLCTALDIGADYIAISFVQKPEDVKEAKKLIKGKAKLISKIEKPQALQHFDSIMKHSDGVMVARGDLGVEIPLEYVPGVQREIIRKANKHNKFVIVATQMLDSMIDHPLPTRAEVNDVSYAVLQGADAVMLSGETAIGNHPVLAVLTMNKIYESALLEMKDKNTFLSNVFKKAQENPIAANENNNDVDKPKSSKSRAPKSP